MDPKPTKRDRFKIKRFLRLPTQAERNGQSASRSLPITPDRGSSPQSARPQTPAQDATASSSTAVGSPVDLTSLQSNEQDETTTTIVSQTAQQANPSVSGGLKNAPCLEKAIQTFKEEHKDWYKALFEDENLILNMAQADTLSHMAVPEGLQETMGRIQTFIRKSQTYLPSLGNIQALAMGLSRLDPHGIAPLVLTGVFFVIQLTLNTVKPEVKEKLLTLLSKSTSIMNKWILFEIGHARSTPAFHSNHFEEVEKLLPVLYKEAFETISRIHQVCKSKASVLFLEDRLPELQLRLSNLENTDRTCTTNREKVDMDLKSKVDKQNLLNWIKGANDPEPSHTNVTYRTGLDDPNTKAAAWFLETSEFQSWVANLYQDNAERVFWLKGIMGTGKTTLVCRIISYFKQYPLDKTRTVFYYCNASATDTQGRGPSYEDIIRGLCSKLAWNDTGELAESAKEFYQHCNSENEKTPHTKRWEKLLRDIISQIDDRILFIIDGLDECSSREDQRKFLNLFRSMQHKSYMILSSRPHVEVTKYMKSPIIKYSVITENAGKDMDEFIHKKIEENKADQTHSQSIILKGEYLSRLVRALTSQADGMFRWVEVWLGVFFNPNEDVISTKKDAEQKLKALEDAKLASDNDSMTQAYNLLWDTNGGSSKDRKRHQIRAFRFVLAARQPLSCEGLLKAIRFDPETPTEYAYEIEMDYLEGLLHNFMKKQSRTFGRTFEFEHVSAKTFVLEIKDPASQRLLFADQSSNHRTIAETSLLLLRDPNQRFWNDCQIHWSILRSRVALIRDKPYRQNIDSGTSNRRYDYGWGIDFGSPTSDSPSGRIESISRFRNGESWAMVYYILSNWWWHCSEIQGDEMYEHLRGVALDIVRDMPVALEYEAVVLRSTPISCTSENLDGTFVVNPLIFALAHGLYPFHSPGGMVEIYPSIGDIMARNSDGETSLHVAVRKNDHRSLKALLEIHARADSSVPLLHSVDHRGRNLLHVAQNSELVRTLLEFEGEWATTANPSPYKLRTSNLLQSVDTRNNTASNNILERCDEESVIWIMERCELTPYYGRIESLGRPLWPVAVRRGFKRVIRLLLYRGASIDGIECPDGTALGVAAAIGDEDMALFLLQQGADVNRPGGDHGTPLGAAVYNGQDKVVALFLGLDALNLERAIRLSPYDHNQMWNHVGDQSREVAEILQHYGRRYTRRFDKSIHLDFSHLD